MQRRALKWRSRYTPLVVARYRDYVERPTLERQTSSRIVTTPTRLFRHILPQWPPLRKSSTRDLYAVESSWLAYPSV